MEKGFEIKCLDHGYVRFIESMGTDEGIIEGARMSTNRGFEGWDKDAKLLEYLYKNGHMSPFELCELHLEIKCPIFAARQIQRHRSFKYNEHSARYSEMLDEFYLPALNELTLQSKSNKQSSAEPMNEYHAEMIQDEMHDDQFRLSTGYSSYLKLGLAREVARINNPVSQYTKFRMSGNLRNWLHFLSLRKPSNAQSQTRAFADAAGQIIQSLWPRTYALFEEHTLYGAKLSRTEKQWIVDNFNAFDIKSAFSEKAWSEFCKIIVKLGGTPID